MTEEEIHKYHQQIGKLKDEYNQLSEKFNLTMERNKRLQKVEDLKGTHSSDSNVDLENTWDERFPELNPENIQTDSSIRKQVAAKNFEKIARFAKKHAPQQVHPTNQESPEFNSDFKMADKYANKNARQNSEYDNTYSPFKSQPSIVDSFGSPSSPRKDQFVEENLPRKHSKNM